MKDERKREELKSEVLTQNLLGHQAQSYRFCRINIFESSKINFPFRPLALIIFQNINIEMVHKTHNINQLLFCFPNVRQ